MATKAANSNGPEAQTPHTSGLFADMTLDGPEIGTLVIVFDRAKNLPNRKTMGKQNPYCAARLGKEAKKTETDRRGGQTPKWDQEIRFTMHDSPDFAKLKLSIFSEDKRTDLIGEAWVDLTDVVVPGGGKKDIWQGLNYKGKYAGELRIELTYYDERPRPAESTPVQELVHSLSNDSSRVKRRPLPTTINSGTLTPDTIPQPGLPGRAKHGPRDLRTPPRANSMPPELHYAQPQPDFATPPHAAMPAQRYGSSPAGQLQLYQPLSNQHYDDYEQYQEPQGYEDAYGAPQQPDFLPQLPPSNRSRGALPPHLQNESIPSQSPPQLRPHSHIGLPHSQSAPIVPTTAQNPQSYDENYQLQMDDIEPSPYLEYQYHQPEMRPRRSDVAPGWQNEQPLVDRQLFAEEMNAAPPPPPVHSNSSPAVPQHIPNRSLPSSPLAPYGAPPHVRHNSIPNSSPLQSFERKYSSPQRSPVQSSPLRGMSMDGYGHSPDQRTSGSSPVGYPAGQTPSPYGRQQAAARLPNRHSIAEPYSMSTPPRPHPLSQEVPPSPSPQPYSAHDAIGSSPPPANLPQNQTEYRTREGLPMIKPRPVSPQRSQPSSQPSSAPRTTSSYDIQFPIRAFESSDKSPLASPQPNARPAPPANRVTPVRKSISPHPTPPNSAGAMPYSPDSFNIHNPNSQAPAVSNGNSPHSPYQIRPGSEALPRNDPNSPIVDWHGKEIDPSDRLPMDSWAPEPEKKTPMKSYGQGRDRDFGPRSANNSAGRNLGKDTVVTMRTRSQTQPLPMQPEPPVSTFPLPTRNRLQKKSAQTKNATIEPLRERHNYNAVSVPNPYEQEPGTGFYSQGMRQPNYAGSYAAMTEDALAREISNIDIGGSRHTRSGSVPAPVAYVPVRSHRDRKTFY